MGKNQQHKQMQRARHGGDAAGDDPATGQDFGADVSFHTPEWHAARIAALTTERMSWEDWKKKQKTDAAAAEALAQTEEAKMRDYRAQLDADRAKRLSVGTNNVHLRDTVGRHRPSSRVGSVAGMVFMASRRCAACAMLCHSRLCQATPAQPAHACSDGCRNTQEEKERSVRGRTATRSASGRTRQRTRSGRSEEGQAERQGEEGQEKESLV